MVLSINSEGEISLAIRALRTSVRVTSSEYSGFYEWRANCYDPHEVIHESNIRVDCGSLGRRIVDVG
jgi:hypothetical protein